MTFSVVFSLSIIWIASLPLARTAHTVIGRSHPVNGKKRRMALFARGYLEKNPYFGKLNNHVIRRQTNLISTLFYGQNDLSSSNGLHIHTHLITLLNLFGNGINKVIRLNRGESYGLLLRLFCWMNKVEIRFILYWKHTGCINIISPCLNLSLTTCLVPSIQI
jgi:hypothetical protein